MFSWSVFFRLFLTLSVCCLSLTGTTAALYNVHVVPHTHDDVGWLKTVDEYYYGANNSIQHAAVQHILDSVTIALGQDPTRTFIYVEQAFFQRWYNEQNQQVKQQVKAFVANGQLEFINGGWCMHDEANTHYVDMVDQTTLGHRFIRQEFGVSANPKVAWQIDPFGHSSTQASLLSAAAGYEGLFFGRIDYRDHDQRMAESNMEFIWAASQSFGSQQAVFTGSFQNGNYGPPDGFCFDWFCNDVPMQDDPELDGYNVPDRVAAFFDQIQNMAMHTKGNNIMITMGSDFQYENAAEWYKNIDKLMKYVNQDGRINMFYSTPSRYVQAKNNEGLTFTVKTDDFFPYADCEDCYWTGYFTSRPALKRYVRLSSAFLQIAKQVEFITNTTGTVDPLFHAVAVAQHHDAVAGTSRQHVAFDYAKRISRGMDSAANGMISSVGRLVTPPNSPASPDFQVCFNMNVSICSVTQNIGMNGNTEPLAVVFYNGLGQTRTNEFVSFPITNSLNTPQAPALNVQDSQGNYIPSQVVPTLANTNVLDSDAAAFSLQFEVSVPALGFSTYFITTSSASKTTEKADAAATKQTSEPVATPVAAATAGKAIPFDGNVTLENDYYVVVLSPSAGGLVSMYDKVSSQEIALSQTWSYYRSWFTLTEGQNSGAYIFRPWGTNTYPVNSDGNIQMTYFSGAVSEEVHIVFSDWVTQIVRLPSGAQYLEVEYAVGPVPIDDAWGKEVITKYSTNIQTSSTFYTDSNAREMQVRIRNYRPTYRINTTSEPITSNYYPMNAAAYIKDESSASTVQLTILNDRSQGVSSLVDGELEIMVHRRTLFDDGRGVSEPLNETTNISPYPDFIRTGKALVITGKHYLILSKPSVAASVWRKLQSSIYQPIQPFIAPLTTTVPVYKDAQSLSNSFLASPLPDNVELMTMNSWDNGSLLLRLAHRFSVGEDGTLSNDVQVDLSVLFSGLGISFSSYQELTLTGNNVLSEEIQARQKQGWNLEWKTVDGSIISHPYKLQQQVMKSNTSSTKPVQSAVITLSPMQIRTFQIFFS